MTSPYETAARTRKAQRILGSIPHGSTPHEIRATAEWLAGLAVADRNRLASAVGVREPSQSTWDLVVKMARNRMSDEELFARAGAR